MEIKSFETQFLSPSEELGVRHRTPLSLKDKSFRGLSSIEGLRWNRVTCTARWNIADPGVLSNDKDTSSVEKVVVQRKV